MSREFPILWREGTNADLWIGNLSVSSGAIRLRGGNGSEIVSRDLPRESLNGVQYADDDQQLVRTKTLRLELKSGVFLITTLAGSEVLAQLFSNLLGLLSGG